MTLRRRFLEAQDPATIDWLWRDWPLWARFNQRPPLSDWRTWLLLGGRGAGKTRTGAEWLKGVALADPHHPGNAAGRIALIGTNYDDARDVMVEGESGLLAIHGKAERPAWYPSRRELEWSNGTIGKLFSSGDPEGIRGSQFGAAWADELCKWRYPSATWDMLQFALRLGDNPRQVVTTTPKPLKLLKTLMEDPATVTVKVTTRENADNLAAGFLDYVEGIYGGTRLGRQELDGEIIEAREDALWNHDAIEQARTRHQPDIERIVIAVDPPAGSSRSSAACGIIGAGIAADGICYVLADRTISKATPDRWGREVVSLFKTLQADLIIAEVNQGGDMVTSVMRTIEPNLPVRAVRASRGKWTRAEPVALLYERGLVRHAGHFAELEEQMCAMGADGSADGVSPDRVDALVWAITELALVRRGTPRVRQP